MQRERRREWPASNELVAQMKPQGLTIRAGKYLLGDMDETAVCGSWKVLATQGKLETKKIYPTRTEVGKFSFIKKLFLMYF